MNRNQTLSRKSATIILTAFLLWGISVRAETTMPAMPTGDRSQQAGGATDTGDSGSDAATGAGIGFMASAAAAFAMLAIPEGIMFTTMGAMEFAQASEDSSASEANTGQQQLLTLDNSSGRQAPGGYNPQAVAEQLGNIPNLTAALQSMGVNPSEFLNKVASGEMRTPEHIVAALGMTDNYTADEIAAMSPSAAMAMGAGKDKLANEESGSSMNATTAANMAARSNAENMHKDGQGANASGSTGGSSKSGSGQGSDGGGFAGMAGAGNGALAVAGKKGEGMTDSLSDIERLALKNKGILKPIGKTTIFHVASRNYQSFKVWRKTRYENPHRKAPKVVEPNTKLALSVP